MLKMNVSIVADGVSVVLFQKHVRKHRLWPLHSAPRGNPFTTSSAVIFLVRHKRRHTVPTYSDYHSISILPGARPITATLLVCTTIVPSNATQGCISRY